jgi:hypothetical protein
LATIVGPTDDLEGETDDDSNNEDTDVAAGEPSTDSDSMDKDANNVNK